MNQPDPTTELRALITDVLTPFFANFSDEPAARANATEAAAALAAALPGPADADRRDRYATAISKWHRDPEQSLYTQGAAAVMAVADAEQAELRARLADYENRITWHTTCGSCARILDSSIQATEQTEAYRLALSEALGLGTGAPWDAIQERAAELAAAVPSAPTSRAALLLWAADQIDAETRQAKADGVLEPDKFRPCRDASAQLRALAGCQECASGLEHDVHCPRPESHNWGCGCPSDVAAAVASCPGREMDGPSPCRCPCEGCKHHCAAHDPSRLAAVPAAEEQPENETPEAPYPTTSEYAIQAYEVAGWGSVTFRRQTLAEAQERRNSYRNRFPATPMRIVRWDETPTVVESDEVPDPPAVVPQPEERP
ncbi:hypothetical protein MUK60_07600 [Streptomyces sp. LRE541]|uniref:hypothetical protein n=1 Tax=Streptomyces sp. LRE541 TaxID=2931983 RepID=UPI00200ECFCD|nr:hypothetical protein [Streptomyces sp. LRE541]UPZ27698.1 hypothetical protein MUK60_07600 [Streptomyces sp. LRE541]